MFAFGKGRPCFGHNTKRLRTIDGVDFTDDYIQDVYIQEYDIPNDPGIEVEEKTELEPIHEERIDEEPSLFNELMRGATLLQGSVIEVFCVHTK